MLVTRASAAQGAVEYFDNIYIRHIEVLPLHPQPSPSLSSVYSQGLINVVSYRMLLFLKY